MIVPALCRQTTGVRPRIRAAGFYFYDGAGFGDKALFKKMGADLRVVSGAFVRVADVLQI